MKTHIIALIACLLLTSCGGFPNPFAKDAVEIVSNRSMDGKFLIPTNKAGEPALMSATLYKFHSGYGVTVWAGENPMGAAPKLLKK